MADDELVLSRDLILGVLDSLKEHDRRCENELIACQYLSAVIGFVVANQAIGATEKTDILEELAQFSKQVLASVSAQAPSQPAPGGSSAEAFGIWKPDAEKD